MRLDGWGVTHYYYHALRKINTSAFKTIKLLLQDETIVDLISIIKRNPVRLNVNRSSGQACIEHELPKVVFSMI